MNLFSHFLEVVRKEAAELAAASAVALEGDLDRVTVEPPRDGAHGDIATNAAMVLA